MHAVQVVDSGVMLVKRRTILPYPGMFNERRRVHFLEETACRRRLAVCDGILWQSGCNTNATSLFDMFLDTARSFCEYLSLESNEIYRKSKVVIFELESLVS